MCGNEENSLPFHTDTNYRVKTSTGCSRKYVFFSQLIATQSPHVGELLTLKIDLSVHSLLLLDGSFSEQPIAAQCWRMSGREEIENSWEKTQYLMNTLYNMVFMKNCVFPSSLQPTHCKGGDLSVESLVLGGTHYKWGGLWPYHNLQSKNYHFLFNLPFDP